MTLIIEDGTIVANANSYVTDAEYVAYAAARGLTIGADATAREIELFLSMDYLYNQDYQGNRAESDTQELPFPRSGVYLYNRLLDSSTIPKELKYAQMEGGIAAKSQSLLVNSANSDVKKQDLRGLSVEYFEGGNNAKIRLDRVNNYLCALLNDVNSLVRT